MRVFGTGVSTEPKRAGLFFRGGDVCDPAIVAKDWFSAPWPTKIRRWRCALTVLPFLCVKIGRFGVYAGWKVYGVDRSEYRNWLPAEDVYEGSLALCLTVRFFTDG